MNILAELKQGAVHAAPLLLGYELVHETEAGIVSGYIVETEAYTQDDAASHTYRGPSVRNRAMYMSAGTVYVYFTYGMHYCVNIVAGPVDSGEAILIRALQPVHGIEHMKQRRGMHDMIRLTNGPAKLTEALAITKILDQTSIVDGPLRLCRGFTPQDIGQSGRIGISSATDTQWRFFIPDNPYVSKRLTPKNSGL